MIYSSPHPSFPIPEGETVWHALERHAEAIGDKPALVCGLSGRVISFSDAHKQALQICAGLAAHGVKRGDVRCRYDVNWQRRLMLLLGGADCDPALVQLGRVPAHLLRAHTARRRLLAVLAALQAQRAGRPDREQRRKARGLLWVGDFCHELTWLGMIRRRPSSRTSSLRTWRSRPPSSEASTRPRCSRLARARPWSSSSPPSSATLSGRMLS